MKTITDNFKITVAGKTATVKFNNGIKCMNMNNLNDCLNFDIHKTIAGLSYIVIENDYSDPLELIKMIRNGSLDLIDSKKDTRYNKIYYGKLFIDRNMGQYMRSKFINKLIVNQLCDSDMNIIEYYRAEIIFKYNKNCKYYLNNTNSDGIILDDTIYYTDSFSDNQYNWYHLFPYYSNIKTSILDRYCHTTKNTLFKSQDDIIKKIKDMSDITKNNIYRIDVIPISNYGWI